MTPVSSADVFLTCEKGNRKKLRRKSSSPKKVGLSFGRSDAFSGKGEGEMLFGLSLRRRETCDRAAPVHISCVCLTLGLT